MSSSEMQQRIFDLILQERKVQDLKYGGAAHDDQKDPDDWVALACRHLGMAASDTDMPFDRYRFERQMVRVAALAMAALESLYRRHQPVEKVAGDYPSGKQW